MLKSKTLSLVMLSFFILLGSTLSEACFGAQPSRDSSVIWSQLYGIAGDRSTSVESLIQTNDGGYAFTAINYTYTPSGNSYRIPSNIVLIKTNGSGALEWEKMFFSDNVWGLVQTSDKGYVFAASSSSGNGTSLIKVDSDGNLQWNKTFPVKSGTVWMEQTSDLGYSLVGSVSGYLWFAKTNSAGIFEWNKTCKINWDGGVTQLVQTNDGNYTILGESFPNNLAVQYAYSGSLVVAKIDSSGNIFWNRTFSDNWNPLSIIQTGNGGYVLADLTTPAGTPTAIKVDPEGNLEWNHTYQAPIKSATETSDGGFAFSGYLPFTSGNWGPLVWVAKTDSTGNVTWNQSYGDKSEGYGVGPIIECNDGNLLVGGIWSGWLMSSPSYWFLMKIQASLPLPTPSPSPAPPTLEPIITPTAPSSPAKHLDFNLIILSAVIIILTIAIVALAVLKKKQKNTHT